jgi:PleD family two-component response regulator
MGGLARVLTRDVTRSAFSSMGFPSQRTDRSKRHAVKEVVMYPEGYGQRVLVVDDDASIRSLLSVPLTYEGYNVFEAVTGLRRFMS